MLEVPDHFTQRIRVGERATAASYTSKQLSTTYRTDEMRELLARVFQVESTSCGEKTYILTQQEVPARDNPKGGAVAHRRQKQFW